MNKYTKNEATKLTTVLYLIILDRNPDSKGLEHWVNELVAGRMNDIDLAFNLLTSKEYQDKMKERK